MRQPVSHFPESHYQQSHYDEREDDYAILSPFLQSPHYMHVPNAR